MSSKSVTLHTLFLIVSHFIRFAFVSGTHASPLRDLISKTHSSRKDSIQKLFPSHIVSGELSDGEDEYMLQHGEQKSESTSVESRVKARTLAQSTTAAVATRSLGTVQSARYGFSTGVFNRFVLCPFSHLLWI